MQTTIRNAESFELPSADEIETMSYQSQELSAVQIRIRENLNVLARFKVLPCNLYPRRLIE